MKILVDIGHPAHIHYFKNTIFKLLEKNEVLIVARDRGIIKDLLVENGLPFFNRGKGRNSKLGKLLYMIWADFHLLFLSIRHKPDLYLSFSSPYPAHVSYLLRKPNIALNDTEHADKISSRFTFPFCDVILTPFCHENNLGEKHIKFNNLTEGLYLHEKYFKPNPSVLETLGLMENEKYVIVRFVSWNAHHDFGQFGLDLETKRKLIELLSTKYKVIISSESELPSEFKKYQFHISPSKMHDALAFAELFIGESATMASESAMLGTHAVYINSLPLMGYLRVEENEGLLKHFVSSEGVLDYIKILMDDANLKKTAIENSKRMKKNFIDPTELLIWFIENYPESFKMLKMNSNYQENFLI